MPGQTKVIISWADDIEEDDDYGPYGGDDLPPPTSKVEGNIKIVTSYKREDGKKFKIINHYKIERIKVSKAVASRKQWKKFGKAREDPPASSLSVATPKPTKVVNADESDTLPSQKSPTENTTESGLSVSSVDRRFRIKVRKTTRPSSTESNKKEITVAPTVQFQSSKNATYNTTLLPVDKKQLDDYSKEAVYEFKIGQVNENGEKEFNARKAEENGNITSSSLSPSSITDVSNPSFSLSSNSSSDLLPSPKSTAATATTTTFTTESGPSVSSVDRILRNMVQITTGPSSTESSKKEITVAPTVQFQSSENATYNTTLLPVDKKQLDDYSKEESNELNTWQVDEKEFNTRGLNENGNITSSSLSPSSITDVSNPSFSLSSNSSSDLLNSSTTESMSTTETSLTSENQNEDNFANQTTTSIPPAPQNTTSILTAPQNETVDNSMEESSNNDVTASPVSSISERNATIIEASISISGPSKSSNSGALNNLNNFWLLVNLVSLSLILICL